jgi:hypothetical protein
MLNINRTHKRTIVLTEPTADIIPPPAGWKLFRATTWPVVELGLSFETFGGSSFEVIPPWIPETRQFTAISNFSVLDNDAVKRLQALQPADGFDLRVKMNWLVSNGTGGTAMWTHSDLGWDTSPTYEAGTMLWGDQLFAASEETFNLNTSIGYGTYRKVMPFRRADWNKDPKQYPYLFPRATVCRPNGGISNDFGRGEIRTMLQVLDPRDYKFTGGIIPSGFYIPVPWCLAV